MEGTLPELTRRNLSEEVYDVLRRGILSKHFAPGERLRLDEIERQLGVSRTPLKVALDRLATEGLVDVKPRRGTYVTQNTPEDTAEAFGVRRVLEVYACELIVERMGKADLSRIRELHEKLKQLAEAGESGGDTFYECIDLDHQFHEELMSQAGSARLKDAWQDVNVHVQMARARSRDAVRLFTTSVEEHERILEAFLASDGDAAKAAMDAHLRRAQGMLLEEMSRQG